MDAPALPGVPVYLGDELSAAGYRLAGARVHSPPPGQEAAALTAACSQAPLVLVSAAVAAAIDQTALHRALASATPLVLVVPDLHEQVPLPDVAARLRVQLGLEA